MSPPNQKNRFDVAIIGSGFAGSILARILSKGGRRVLMIDSATHPRFSIGESSTPIADLLIRRLSDIYELPELGQFSTFGSWQKSFPQIPCGLKRGFSYFDHRTLKNGVETKPGANSLIVAASPSDERSDTHWYRSDFDAFLFQSAKAVGVQAKESSTVTAIRPGILSRLSLHTGEAFEANYVIDASGTAAVTSKLLNADSLTHQLKTNTCASFAHYEDIGSFSERFRQLNRSHSLSDPFDADDAAQHHLINNGWAWFLRFNNGITSVGCVQRGSGPQPRDASRQLLRNHFDGYPVLSQTMKSAMQVAPKNGIVTTERIQRLYDPVLANNILSMPTSAVTIDPLHSTGIAHALAGVYRIAEIILNEASVNAYRSSVKTEAMFLDRLVSLAYESMPSFDRFTAACMVYFAAAIDCEERIIAGDMPRSLWNSDDPPFRNAIHECADALANATDESAAIDRVRRIIEPWNQVGLLDKTVQNRYRYTATK